MLRGFLVEYALSLPPLVLVFEFNPQTLSRTRTIQLPQNPTPGFRGYGFTLPTETPRVAQGVTAQPEEFSMEILLDATDRMNTGDPIATNFGVEPELDTLRTMVEPKTSGPGGLQVMSSLGLGEQRAFQRDEHASVLLLGWGTHLLPVFLTSVQVEERAHLPTLIPYRANATLSFRVIEGQNPFYAVEQVRQLVGVGLNLGSTLTGSVSLSFGLSF
jgi:hypothetical protein